MTISGEITGIISTPSQAKIRSTAHIGEIDGLRAIAVFIVLLFHVNVLTKGGFIGVDVFFVISGYLITGILLNQRGDVKQRLAQFWARRILRITPALFSTLLLTAIVFFIVLPPKMSASLLPAFTSATFSYSNFWLYLTTNYFANNATNPILHTWSLAVEEQFYLIFPLIIIAASGRDRKTLHRVIGILFCVSLVAACLIAPTRQSDAFFFPWLRAWELFAGALLHFYAVRELPEKIRRALSYLGLILIIIPSVFYTEKMSFPGISAILPVAGAAFMIAGVGSGGYVNRFLCLPPMQWAGKISYSLYLVHWPMICLASLTITLSNRTTKAGVLMASVVLATLSWRYVERPFREMAGHIQARKIFLMFFLSSGLMLASVMALQAIGNTFWNRFPDALTALKSMDADPTLFRHGSCLLSSEYPDPKFFKAETCLAHTPGRKAALVLGDSHAANIVYALSQQHPSVSILQATSVGCKPMLTSSGPAYCRALIDNMLNQWIPNSSADVDTVILAARWGYTDLQSLQQTITYLHQLKKKVIVYGPSPEYVISAPLMQSYQHILGIDLRHIFLRTELYHMHQSFKAAIEKNGAYFSAFPNLCMENSCTIENENGSFYSDRDHLTRLGTTIAVKGFPLPIASSTVEK